MFPLTCRPWAGIEDLNEILNAISSENIQLLRSYIVTYGNKLEEVIFFFEEEFLLKKISNKDVYVDYGVMADIPEDAAKQYGDLIASK